MPAPSQEIYDLYSDQLRMLKYGLALYEPEPNEGEGPVQIGDVGYIDFGRFMPFSSTFLSLHGTPAIDEKYRAITKLAKLDKGVMSSRSVRSERIAVELSASVNYRITTWKTHARITGVNQRLALPSAQVSSFPANLTAGHHL